MTFYFSKISSVASKSPKLGFFYAYSYISVLAASTALILLTNT